MSIQNLRNAQTHGAKRRQQRLIAIALATSVVVFLVVVCYIIAHFVIKFW